MNEDLLELAYSKMETESSYEDFKKDFESDLNLQKLVYSKFDTEASFEDFIKDVFGEVKKKDESDSISPEEVMGGNIQVMGEDGSLEPSVQEDEAEAATPVEEVVAETPAVVEEVVAEEINPATAQFNFDDYTEESVEPTVTEGVMYDPKEEGMQFDTTITYPESSTTFERSLSYITPQLIRREEEEVVNRMDYLFGDDVDGGFEFEETDAGDAMIVTASNGETHYVNLDKFGQILNEDGEYINSLLESERPNIIKFQEFLRNNRKPFEGDEVSYKEDLENIKYFSRKAVDLDVATVKSESNALTQRFSNYKKTLSNVQFQIDDLSQQGSLNPEQLALYNSLLSQKKELSNEKNSITDKYENLIKSNAQIERNVGEYLSMKLDDGNAVSTLAKGFMNGLITKGITAPVASLVGGVMDVFYGVAQSIDEDFGMTEDEKKERYVTIAKDLGYDVPDNIEDDAVYNSWIEGLNNPEMEEGSGYSREINDLLIADGYDPTRTLVATGSGGGRMMWKKDGGLLGNGDYEEQPDYAFDKTKGERLKRLVLDAEVKESKNPTKEYVRHMLDFMAAEGVSDERVARNKGESIIQEGLYGLAESLPSIALYALARGKNKAAAEPVKGVLKRLGRSFKNYITNRGAVAQTLGFTLLQTDALMVEMENDPDFKYITETEKKALTLPLAITTAVLERWGLRSIVTNKTLVANLMKTVTSRLAVGASPSAFRTMMNKVVQHNISKGVYRVAGATVMEYETGGLQQVAEIGMKDVWNDMYEKEMFTTPDGEYLEWGSEYLQQVNRAALAEAVGGFVMGTPGAIATAFNKNQFDDISDDMVDLFDEIRNDKVTVEAYKARLDLKVIAKEMTKEEAQKALLDFEVLSSSAETVSGIQGLTKQQTKEALGLTYLKNQLEHLLSKTDPNVGNNYELIEAQLNDVTSKLKNIGTSRVITQEEEELVEDIKSEQDILDTQDLTQEDRTAREENLTKLKQELSAVQEAAPSQTETEQNAIQEPSTEEVDVQESSLDSGEMGEGDTTVQPSITGETQEEGESESDIAQTAEEEVSLDERAEQIDELIKKENEDSAPKEPQPIPEEQIEVVDETISINKPKAPPVRNNPLRESVIRRAKNVSKSLKKVFPNVKIILHETSEAFVDATGRLGRGEYIGNTIHVNLELADGTTVGHEAFHVIIVNKLLTNTEAQEVTKRMLKSLLKTLRNNDPLAIEIRNFMKGYDQKIQTEEGVSQMLGILSSRYKLLAPKQKTIIGKWIDIIKKLLGKEVDIITESDQQVVDLLNTLISKLTSGIEIESSDLSVIDKIKEDVDNTPAVEEEVEAEVETAPEEEVEKQVPVTQAQKNLFGETHTDENLKTPSNPKGQAKISNITSLDKEGVSTATYVNVWTGSVDVIISSKDKKNFVGYVRVYKNGKPTNMFSTKMESTGGAFKNMITSADTTLPDGAKVLPGKTISEGGLKSFNNSKLDVETDSDGNVVTRETDYSDATKETVKQKGDRAFGKFVTPVKSKAEAEIVKIQKAYPGIKAKIVKSGLSFAIKIDLPVLIKTETTQRQQKVGGILSKNIDVTDDSNRKGLVPVEQLKDFIGEDRVGYAEMTTSRETIDKLKEDIKENGFKQPILVVYDKFSDKGEASIIEGNHRIQAAIELGLKEVPVKFEKGTLRTNEQREADGMFPLNRKTVGEIDTRFGVDGTKLGLEVRQPTETDIVTKSAQKPTQRQQKTVEGLREGKMTTTTPVKIYKGIGGKMDIFGQRINAHKGVKGIFSAVDKKLAEEYGRKEGVAEIDLPSGVTIEVVEVATKGLDPKQYRAAEVKAINESDAQVVKLITIEGKVKGLLRNGDGKQQQYIIKDFDLVPELKAQKPTTRQQRTERLAPNGKRSNLTDVQYDTVRTKAFKNWFGNWETDPENASKVVDENGEPLVVYHGTPDGRFLDEDGIFKSQDQIFGMGSGIGVHWFAKDITTAKSYAKDKFAFDYQNSVPKVLPAFLNIKNPFIKNGENSLWRNVQQKGKTRNLISKALESKKDGVIVDNVKDNYNNSNKTKSTDTFTVFNSNQIKLADGSNKTFDPDAPSIRQQQVNVFEGGEQQQGEGGEVGVIRLQQRQQQDFISAPKVDKDSRPWVKRVTNTIDVITLNGKNFITNMYDYTNAGRTDLGNGYEITLFGGRNYVPYIMDILGKKLGDVSHLAAFNTKAQAETFIRNSIEGDANYFAPHAGTLDGSWQFQQHIFEALTDMVLDKNIISNEELIKSFNRGLVRTPKALALALKEYKKNDKSFTKKGYYTQNKKKIYKAPVKPTKRIDAFKKFLKKYNEEQSKEDSKLTKLKNTENLNDFLNNPKKLVRLLNIENNFSPDLRKRLNQNIATNAKFKKAIGISKIDQFHQRIIDPLNKGVEGGEIMSFVKFDPSTFEIVKTDPNSPEHHPSFGWVVKAKIEQVSQPTKFYKSYEITDQYVKHNKNETIVSKKEDVTDAEFKSSNVSSSAGAIPKVAQVSIKESTTQRQQIVDDTKSADNETKLRRFQDIVDKFSSATDIVNMSRMAGFEDTEIRYYLQKKWRGEIDSKGNYKKLTVKEINKLLKAEELETVPASFGNVPGGMIKGLKLYQDTLAHFKKLIAQNEKKSKNKQISIQDIIHKSIEFMSTQTSYIDSSEGSKAKKQLSTLQQQLQSEMYEALGGKKIKEITKIISNLNKIIYQKRIGAREIRDVKRELQRVIREVMPKGVYTSSEVRSLLRQIQEAEPKWLKGNLKNIIQNIEEMAAEKNVSTLTKSIDEILNGKYVVTINNQSVGVKISQEYAEVLEAIKDKMYKGAEISDDIISEQAYIMTKIEELDNKMSLSPEEEMEYLVLNIALGINNAKLMDNNNPLKADQLLSVFENLKSLVTQGRNNFKADAKARSERYAKLTAKFYQALTNGEDVLDFTDEAVREKVKKAVEDARTLKNSNYGKEGTINKLKSYFQTIADNMVMVLSASTLDMSQLNQQLDMLPGEMFEGYIRDFMYRKVNESSRSYQESYMALQDLMTEKSIEYLGKKYTSKIKEYRKSLDFSEIENGKFFKDPKAVKEAQDEYNKNKTIKNRNTLNKVIALNIPFGDLTPMKLQYIYFQYKQPDTHAGFETSLGSNYKVIMDGLSKHFENNYKDLLNFGNWQVDVLLPLLHSKYNKVYKKIYHTNMPQRLNYSGRTFRLITGGGKVEMQQQDPLSLLGGKGTSQMSLNVIGNSTKLTKPNKEAIMAVDALTAIDTYLKDMEHFNAYAVNMNDISKVFFNKDIADTIINIHGKLVYNAIKNSLMASAMRGANQSDEIIRMTNSTNNVFIINKIGGALTVYIKQLTSIATYGNFI